jgi:hypothetical protein
MTASRQPRRPGHWRRYRVLYAVIAICMRRSSPYRLLRFSPSGRTNYGTLITPRPLPPIPLTALDGRPFSFAELAGKWVMVAAAPAACDAACASALLQMRQQRLMTGKERDRIERVWLITDEAPVASELLREYDGTRFVRAPVTSARDFASDDSVLAGRVWLVDPMGNLMLRWPQDPEPQRVKKDLSLLLTASSHWLRVERKD